MKNRNATGIAAALVLLVATSCGGSALGDDLDCPQLAEAVASYQEAFDYYRTQGEPIRLDSDGDGVPCEDDFTPREIQAVLGTTTSSSTPGVSSSVASTTTTVTLSTTTDPVDATTTTSNDTATPPPTETTTVVPVGQFASAVGGTTPRVCQRWLEDLGEDNSLVQDGFFGMLRETSTVGVGTIAVFCLFGFDFTVPVSVSVTGSNGVAEFSINLDSVNEPNTAADPLAGEDLLGDGDIEGIQWVARQTGTYSFVATQGDLTKEATVQIVSSSTPRIDAFIENRGGFPGSLGFALSGFPPGTAVQLGIYEDITDPFGDDGTPSDHEFSLVQELSPVQVGSNGATIVYLQEGDFVYEQGRRLCLATTLDLIPEPVCDNFRGGWFTP